MQELTWRVSRRRLVSMSMTWLRSAAPVFMAAFTFARLAATSCSADSPPAELAASAAPGLLRPTADVSTSMKPSGGAKLTVCISNTSLQPSVRHHDSISC